MKDLRERMEKAKLGEVSRKIVTCFCGFCLQLQDARKLKDLKESMRRAEEKLERFREGLEAAEAEFETKKNAFEAFEAELAATMEPKDCSIYQSQGPIISDYFDAIDSTCYIFARLGHLGDLHRMATTFPRLCFHRCEL